MKYRVTHRSNAEGTGIQIWAESAAGTFVPEVLYPDASISRAAINLMTKHEQGVETRLNQVTLVARSESPAKVVQTFTFDTGAEAEEFYSEVIAILGWT